MGLDGHEKSDDFVIGGVLEEEHVFCEDLEEGDQATLGVKPRVGAQLGERRSNFPNNENKKRTIAQPTFRFIGSRLLVMRDMPNS